MIRRAFLGAVCSAIGAAVLAAPASGWAKPAVHVIRIAQMAFAAAPAGLRVGDTIEWVNGDLFEHTVTARNGAFDLDIKPSKSARVVLKASGAIEVYCRFHPGMTGRLTVAP